MADQARAREAPPIDDRERLAWLRPLVYEMRDRLRRIELSRFWQIRNAFFAIKHRLGFSSDSSWDVFEIPPAYAAILDEADPYAAWRARNDPRPGDLAQMRRAAAAFANAPSFGVVVCGEAGAAYDDTLVSLRQQAYPHWRAVGEHDRSADFVTYVDAGDRLAPDALFAYAVEIAAAPDVDVVYADEDSLGPDGLRAQPQFKPDWSPETLLSRDYVGKAVAFRSTLLDRTGGLRPHFGPAARYDLTLRATEVARTIAHAARIVYHGRIAAPPDVDSTYTERAREAIAEALERRGEAGRPQPTGPSTFVVRYAIASAGKVSILLPTRDHPADLERCLTSLFGRTTYRNFELLLVDNGTADAAALAVIERFRAADARMRVLPMDVPFNYSLLNNRAARQASGEYVVLLNNDTEVVTPDWLEAMMEQAQRPQIGAVGAHLLYPDGFVQHGGVVLGIGGVAGHSHRGVAPGAAGYFEALRTATNYAAVTAACLMVRKAVFDEAGGLDETLTVAFNDVDFCLRVLRAGYRNVWLPHVVLTHGESRSRGHDVGLRKTHRSLVEQRLMMRRWDGIIAHDPYYSPHLTRLDESYAIRVEA